MQDWTSFVSKRVHNQCDYTNKEQQFGGERLGYGVDTFLIRSSERTLCGCCRTHAKRKRLLSSSVIKILKGVVS